MTIFLNILLVMAIIVGFVSIPFGIPGTFIILGAAFLYALATKFVSITWTTLLVLLAAALIAEAIEAGAVMIGAKKYGSGKAGIAAALLGGIAGALLGAPFFFGLGALLGALAGAFTGAVTAEIISGSPFDRALQAGWGTLLGRLAGTLTKITVASAMAVICIIKIL